MPVLRKDHAPTKKLDHDPIQFGRIMVQVPAVDHKQRGRAKAASHPISVVSEGRLDAGAAPAAAVGAARPDESRAATGAEAAAPPLFHDRCGVLELRMA